MKLKGYVVSCLFCVVAVFMVVMTFGCNPFGDASSGLKLGVEIPKSEPIVSLAAVMENPSKYNGKQIVMNGFVSGQCASLCEFFFKEGVHTATIYPQGFKFQQKNISLYPGYQRR